MANNILFLITGLNTGGAEMQVYQMIKKLRKLEIYRPVVASLLPLGPVGEKLQKDGVTVYSLGMERGKPSVSALLKLKKIIKEEKIKIIHSHLFHAHMLARSMKLFQPSIKLVSTIHSINIGGRNRELMLRYTNSLSDSVTIISEIARQHFIQTGAVSANQLRFIPNGVDTTEFINNPSSRMSTREKFGIKEEFTWLAAGRFDEPKNYPNLLKAFSLVLKVTKHTRLILAGIGPQLEDMKKLAKELGINKYVQFLGYRSDIPDLLNASDAYVMSSSWEGLPLVLLEASAARLPIVCTNVGGNREIVIDRLTGFIVEPESVDSLANNMVELSRLPEKERVLMGQKGYEYIQKVYGMDQVMCQWDELYKEILSVS